MIGMLTWTPPAGIRQRSVTVESKSLFHMRCDLGGGGQRFPDTGAGGPAAGAGGGPTAAEGRRHPGGAAGGLPLGGPAGEGRRGAGIHPASAAESGGGPDPGGHGGPGTLRRQRPGGGGGGPALRPSWCGPSRSWPCGHRYVLVDVPYGGEALAGQLRREYGVSLLLSPTRQQLEEADVLVLFAARTDLRRKNPVVLPLYDESAPLPPLLLPPALEEQLPRGLRRPQLLAALVEGGVLRPGQITVGAGGP